MTVAAGTVPEYLKRDLADALAKYTLAREVNPNHEEPAAGKWHTGCDVCITQRRFDYLTDQLPRPAS